MSGRTQSERAQDFERELSKPNSQTWRDIEERTRSAASDAYGASNYKIWVERDHPAGQEIYGPHKVTVDQFDESKAPPMRRSAVRTSNVVPFHNPYDPRRLYGPRGSQLHRFRTAIEDLAKRADALSKLEAYDAEYLYQLPLFWADILSLKDYLKLSPSVAEIVAELRIARFQVMGKETPPLFLKGIADGLKLVADAQRIDTELVDAMVDAMEVHGFDAYAPDILQQRPA